MKSRERSPVHQMVGRTGFEPALDSVSLRSTASTAFGSLCRVRAFIASLSHSDLYY